jgi:isopenicillin N synthase-like dioxygenase
MQEYMISTDSIYDEHGAGKLTSLLQRSGFAILSGAISATLHELALTSARELFRLPEAEKLALEATEPLMPGFGPYGQSHALDSGIANLLESWTLSRPTPERFPEHMLPAWAAFMHLDSALRSVTASALTALDLSFKSRGELLSLLTWQGCGLHLLHYPRLLLERGEGRRQSVHHDSTLVTLLPRPTHPGLLVEVDHRLEPVVPESNDVIMMAGAALEYATAGKIRACMHTVDTPSDSGDAADRTAMVFFGAARIDATLQPISPLRTDDECRRRPAIPVASFQAEYFDNIFTEKA